MGNKGSEVVLEAMGGKELERNFGDDLNDDSTSVRSNLARKRFAVRLQD